MSTLEKVIVRVIVAVAAGLIVGPLTGDWNLATTAAAIVGMLFDPDRR